MIGIEEMFSIGSECATRREDDIFYCPWEDVFVLRVFSDVGGEKNVGNGECKITFRDRTEGALGRFFSSGYFLALRGTASRACSKDTGEFGICEELRAREKTLEIQTVREWEDIDYTSPARKTLIEEASETRALVCQDDL
jgi:hypothetical protein